jgi:hypothetical protein
MEPCRAAEPSPAVLRSFHLQQSKRALLKNKYVGIGRRWYMVSPRRCVRRSRFSDVVWFQSRQRPSPHWRASSGLSISSACLCAFAAATNNRYCGRMFALLSRLVKIVVGLTCRDWRARCRALDQQRGDLCVSLELCGWKCGS